MRAAIRISLLSICVVVFSFSSAVRVHAQDGKLKLHVTPKQAYVFVDGHAISEASKAHTLKLSAGDHKLELVNYGYLSANRDITINAGQTTELEVTLTPVNSTVAEPFGAMTIEGATVTPCC